MFDPYHKWLGIPKKYRPPTYYQLLGISPQEDDPEVIEEAAIRQLAHLRTYQIGEHGELCTKLLNEVSQARTVLLDPVKRKKYDAELTKKGIPLTTRLAMPEPAPSGLVPPAASAAPLAPPRPVPAAQVAPPSAAEPSAFADLDAAPGLVAKPGNSAVRKSSPATVAKPGLFGGNKALLLAGAGGGVVLLLLLILIPVLLLSGGGKNDNDPGKNPVAQNGGKGKNNDPPKENEPVQPRPEPNPNPVPNPNPIPDPMPMPNPQPGPGPVVNPNPGPPVPAASDPKLLDTIDPGFEVWRVCPLPNGREIILVGGGNRVEKFDMNTKQSLGLFQEANMGGHPPYVKLSADGTKLLVFTRNTKRIHLWDVATGKHLGWCEGENYTRDADFLPGGQKIVSADNQTLYFWDIQTKQEELSIPFANPIKSMAVCPDQNKAVILTKDQFPEVWDLAKRKKEGVITLPGGHYGRYFIAAGSKGFFALDYSPDSKDFTVGLCFGNTAEPGAARSFPRQTNYSALAISPDGKHAVTGQWTGFLQLWDVASGKIIREFKGHPSALSHILFAPDGKKFYTCGYDHLIKIWQMPDQNDVAAGPKPEPGPANPAVPGALPRPQLKVLSAKEQSNGGIVFALSVTNWADFTGLVPPAAPNSPGGRGAKRQGISVKLLFDGQQVTAYFFPGAKDLENFGTVIPKGKGIPKTMQVQLTHHDGQVICESEVVPVPPPS